MASDKKQQAFWLFKDLMQKISNKNYKTSLILIRLVLLVLSTVFVCKAALAEPDNFRFYPHDYAKSPLDGSDPSVGTGDGQSPDSSTNQQGGVKQGNVQAKSIFEQDGEKIEGLSLVTSGLDYDKLLKQTTKMLEIFNTKKVQPAQVYLIGRSSEKKPKELAEKLYRINMLAAELKDDALPPENLQIEKVPTWIISLKTGDIVLEGIEVPDQFINSKGEFIEPEFIDGVEKEVLNEMNSPK